jgi:UDP-glucose 4-epimerase
MNVGKLRVLVLGASGFLGDACARVLSELGHNVTGVGRRGASALGGPAYHASPLQAADMRRLMGEWGPDLCLNAAGSGRPSASISAPGADFEANTALVQRTFEALRLEAPHCRYIGFSSAAVYGDNPQLPWREDARPSPCSPYGYHKLCAEVLAEEYHRFYGLATLTLRAFSVYGPGLRKQLFWDLFHRSRREAELSLFGTGRETRDYIYIDDVAMGVAQLAGRARFAGETLNVGSGRATSVSEASGIFLRELGWKGAYRFTGEEIAGSPLRMEADMTLSFAMGFRPQTDLNEGLRRTAEWLRKTQDDVSQTEPDHLRA